jgi:hypothetical protein
LLVAAFAFGLEFRRWLDEGVRLSVSVIVGAKIIGGYERDDNKYLNVTVTNRGNAPTTITHMVLYNYPSRLARWVPQWLYRRVKRFHAETYIINAIGAPGPIPYVLEPGRMFCCLSGSTAPNSKERSTPGGCMSGSFVPTVSGRSLSIYSENGNHRRTPKQPNNARPLLPAAVVCRAQAALHFLIRISPDLPQLKCPLCLFSTSGRVIALVFWIRHDKGTTPMKKVSLGMAAVLALLSIAGCAQYVGKGKAPPPAAPVVTKG